MLGPKNFDYFRASGHAFIYGVGTVFLFLANTCILCEVFLLIPVGKVFFVVPPVEPRSLPLILLASFGIALSNSPKRYLAVRPIFLILYSSWSIALFSHV